MIATTMMSSAKPKPRRVQPKEAGCFILFIVLLSPILYIGAGLLWIAYWPLPHTPRFEPVYTIQDKGAVNLGMLPYQVPLDPYEEYGYGWRLGDNGTIHHLSDAEINQYKMDQKSAIDSAEQQLGGIKAEASEAVAACTDTQHAIVECGIMPRLSYQLWNSHVVLSSAPSQLKGYRWSRYEMLLFMLNKHDTAFGNGRIATALASSGGTSDPHGRWMPIVWRAGQNHIEDVNSIIDARSGWYLLLGVDINSRGQLLCVGAKTDDRTAENNSWSDAHWLVLTPK